MIGKFLRWVAVLLTLVILVSIGAGYWWYRQAELLELFDPPQNLSRRSADFTVNFGGQVHWPSNCWNNDENTRGFIKRILQKIGKRFVRIRYRLNHGSWVDLHHTEPRTPWPFFTVELSSAELRSGNNVVAFQVYAPARSVLKRQISFSYKSDLIKLPIIQSWEKADLVMDEGHWETFQSDGIWRVRPKPGYEGFDRVLIVSGAIPEGRRIETDLVFRHRVKFEEHGYGFGIFAMWGGRPDDHNIQPRRGWNFGLGWYWDRYKGVGCEFSYKFGGKPPSWVNSYRNLELRRNTKYFVVIECWPEEKSDGQHERYRMRMKWWPADKTEPDEWLELTDAEGSPIPPGEYGVALMAYYSQVDFGPVVIKPLRL